MGKNPTVLLLRHRPPRMRTAGRRGTIVEEALGSRRKIKNSARNKLNIKIGPGSGE